MHRDTTRKCHVCRETRHYARECKDKKSDTVKVVLQDTTRKCHLCGYTGHYARDCKGKKSNSKELVLQDTTRKCNVCEKTGHYARECKDKKSNTVKVVFKEIIGSGIRSSKKAQGWYLFFGSSAHVCYSRDMFVDYTPMINHKVILDNKDHVDVVRTGTVVLR
ncbi:ribosomal protein [Tanacetum coccineum]